VVVRWHKNGTSRTSRMRDVPSVRESWSRPPRPPRLPLHGVPTVQNRGHDCLRPRNFRCAVTAQREQRCRNGMARTSHMLGISWSRSPRPSQLLLRGVPTVRSRGYDWLVPRDFRCAVTAQGELRRVTVPPGTPNIAMSHADRGPPRVCHPAPLLRDLNVQNSVRLHGKGCWPHPRVHSLSRGGPEGHCRYPEDRVPPCTSYESRRKTRWACVSRGSGSRLPAQGAPEPPRAPWPRLPSPGSGQLQSRHVPHDSSSRH
jgi:hypothetical protein